MSDDSQGSAAAKTAWYAIRCGLEGTQPSITLDTQTAAEAVGYTAGIALTWMRNWHRLALASGVTPEEITAIEANAELAALADSYVLQGIDEKMARLLLKDAPGGTEQEAPGTAAS